MKTLAGTPIWCLILIFVISFWFFGGCSRNVDEVKSVAPKVFSDMGYTIVGYEGYTLACITGGEVWYLVRRKEDNGILYNCYLVKWFDEYHIYSLRAIDAIKP